MIDATYQREIQSARARAAERLAHLAVEAVPDPEELSEQLDGTYGLPDLS
ncbi:MAG: hypothetical protein HYZ28_28755 [Myxococcales bacterium]|nr:hypothetical protein [Myxococcales bacterium]